MNRSPEVVLAAFWAMAGIGILIWTVAGRFQLGRQRLRRMYADERTPIWLRNSIGVMPIIVFSAFGLGALVLLPRWLAAWLSIPLIALTGVAFALCYRVPAPFLPRWLHDDIERGLVPVPRPERGDWIVLGILTTVLVLGCCAGLFYLVVFHGGPAGT